MEFSGQDIGTIVGVGIGVSAPREFPDAGWTVSN
jgi:hypothetical protein